MDHTNQVLDETEDPNACSECDNASCEQIARNMGVCCSCLDETECPECIKYCEAQQKQQ